MNRFLIVLLLTFSFPSFAQEDLNARDPRLNEGRLFTVKLTPGTRRLVVSIAGKPGVELGPAQVAVFGKIFGTNGSARKLSIQPSGSAFAIGDELKTGQEIELEIREKRKDGKKEVLKMEAP